MHHGNCACGSVTYTLSTDPMFVHCCHCTECQRLTGSAFALNALIETDRVSVRGQMVDISLPTPSGHGQLLKRCADCGTAIYSHYLIRGTEIAFVRVGTLVDPSACPPDVNIWTGSRRKGIPTSDDIPDFVEFYSVPDVWPQDALERRHAVTGGK